MRGVVGNRAGIQEGPRLAVDVKLIAAELARISRIESLVGSRDDGAVELRDQEGLPVIDGEDGRPNDHFQGHGDRLQAR